MIGHSSAFVSNNKPATHLCGKEFFVTYIAAEIRHCVSVYLESTIAQLDPNITTGATAW